MTSRPRVLSRVNRTQPQTDAALVPLSPPGTRDAAPRGIPRIIHQTYPTADLPEPLAQAVARVRELNPGWSYRFYDDAAIEAFIAAEYPPEILRCYQRIDPNYGAARVDLFRYLLLFRCGGVYLDIKTHVTAPLDSVLRDDDVFVSAHWGDAPHAPSPYRLFGRHPELAWYPHGELQQWHIIAQAGHPFLEAVIRRVLRNLESYTPFRYGVGKMGVMRLTGPIPYTEAIVPLLPLHPHRIVSSEHALGLQYTVFSDGGGHKSHFATHYSRLSTPILPVRAVVERSFTLVRRLGTLARGVQEQAYRGWRFYKRLRQTRS